MHFAPRCQSELSGAFSNMQDGHGTTAFSQPSRSLLHQLTLEIVYLSQTHLKNSDVDQWRQVRSHMLACVFFIQFPTCFVPNGVAGLCWTSFPANMG